MLVWLNPFAVGAYVKSQKPTKLTEEKQPSNS